MGRISMTKLILNALTRAWGLKAGLLFFTLLMTAFPSGATGETVKSQIAAGSYHTLAIKSDGTLWAWGYNYSGQLGDGTTSNKTTPVQIGTGTNWSQIAAGGYHSLAIKSDGTLWAWSGNSFGQLGDGTSRDYKTTPVQIGTGTNWSQIAAGDYHTLAIKSDGTLWAWGYNSYGQLGDGASGGGNYKTTPVQIGTGTNWSQIAAGGYHTLAIKSDGTLWAWGGNSFGQLGDGTSSDYKTTPVQIGTGTNWSQIAAGGYHTLAIKSDRTLWAWGNYYGQLGDATAWKETPQYIMNMGVALPPK